MQLSQPAAALIFNHGDGAFRVMLELVGKKQVSPFPEIEQFLSFEVFVFIFSLIKL